MVITEITAENLDWINQERKKRKISPPLTLKSYTYIKKSFYGTLNQQDYILVSFEKFKQLTNPQIIELW